MLQMKTCRVRSLFVFFMVLFHIIFCIQEKNVNLREILDAHEVDVLCLQEIKLQEGPQCEEVWKKMQLTGWHVTWNCSKAKKGYSGTAVISKLVCMFSFIFYTLPMLCLQQACSSFACQPGDLIVLYSEGPQMSSLFSAGRNHSLYPVA